MAKAKHTRKTAEGVWCPDCEVRKPESEFYKNAARRDGLATVCKPCCADRQRRYKSTEHGKEKARNWMNARNRRPDVVEQLKEYARRPATKARRRAAGKRQRATDRHKERKAAYNRTERAKEITKASKMRHAEKVKARIQLNLAVYHKTVPHISTQTCIRCGVQAAQYHHHNGYDESHWLDVVPVCTACHGILDHALESLPSDRMKLRDDASIVAATTTTQLSPAV